MAEISYPFGANSAGGGSQMVSQAQWQQMAHGFGPDRIDMQLTASNYATGSLPLWASVTNGRQLTITPGNAWVGGFYYQLTAPATLTVPDNTSSYTRMDLIVLRADLATGSVNVTLSTGQPAASPITPTPQRVLGGRWELALCIITSPANNGALTLTAVQPFDAPETVTAPWNAAQVAGLAPKISFVVDADSNTNDTQTELFTGRDGIAPSRTLGKSTGWTPGMTNPNSASASGNTSATRVGRYRWIAPNTVFFSVRYTTGATAPTTGSASALTMNLPVAANGSTGQVLKGVVYNLTSANSLPNIFDITMLIPQGSSPTYGSFIRPSTIGLIYGYDNLTLMPAHSTLTLSGVYEANQYKE